MKKLYFIPVSILLTLTLYGQRNYNNYTGISMGVSVPLGDFASVDSANRQAGYGQSSFFLAFDGAYLFSPYMGVCGIFSFANTTLNTGRLKENIKARIRNDYPDLVLPEESYISYNLGVWNQIRIHAGPQVSLPFNRLSIDIRVLGGISFILAPSNELYFYNKETSQQFRTISDTKQTVALGYTLGGGLRYLTPSHVILRLMVDYTYAEASVEITSNFTDSGIPHNEKKEDHTQPMNTILIGAGIAYHF